MRALCLKKEWTILNLSQCLTSVLKEEKTRYYWQPHSCPGNLFEKVLLKLERREKGAFAIYWASDLGLTGVAATITLFRAAGPRSGGV